MVELGAGVVADGPSSTPASVASLNVPSCSKGHVRGELTLKQQTKLLAGQSILGTSNCVARLRPTTEVAAFTDGYATSSVAAQPAPNPRLRQRTGTLLRCRRRWPGAAGEVGMAPSPLRLRWSHWPAAGRAPRSPPRHPRPDPAPATSPATGAPTAGASSPPATAGSWLSYHYDQARTGAVPAGASLDHATRAWSADLGGAVYGQPLVADGKIIAATETNRVVALDPRDGKVLWSVSLGTPLTDVGSVAGCGNIDPLGITSTPVIDPAAGIVYVVGEISSGGTVHHQLEGIRLANGAVALSENVDPPLPSGESPVNLLQRTSLALANGRVYVSYGGNYGDCGSYHGWVVGVDTTGAKTKVSFEVASDGEGGAIWQSGGAPAVDASGNVYVTTGNANPDPPEGGPDPKKYTESAVKLTPDLKPLASFKDTVAGGDEDLSTSNPGTAAGRDALRRRQDPDRLRLAPVGSLAKGCHQRGLHQRPGRRSGLRQGDQPALRPLPAGRHPDRRPHQRHVGQVLSGANSSPILIGTSVWAVQYNDGTLTEYDAASGKTRQSLSVGSSVPNFTSPSTGLGLLLVGTDNGVTALRGVAQPESGRAADTTPRGYGGQVPSTFRYDGFDIVDASVGVPVLRR